MYPFEITFLIAVGFFYFLSRKVKSWKVISMFGFLSATPVMFMTKGSKIYDIFLLIFFFAVIILSFYLERIAWYVAQPVLVFIWLLSRTHGKYDALAEYRKIVYDISISEQDNEDDVNTIMEAKKALEKSDQELLEGIGLTIL